MSICALQQASTVKAVVVRLLPAQLFSARQSGFSEVRKGVAVVLTSLVQAEPRLTHDAYGSWVRCYG